MVGGAEEEFTAAKELLSCMGANVVYCGQVGTGQVRATFLEFPNYRWNVYRCAHEHPVWSSRSRLPKSATTCFWPSEWSGPRRQWTWESGTNKSWNLNRAAVLCSVGDTAVLLTHRLGLDPKLLAKILNMSSGRCWSSDTYNPVPGVMEGVPSGNNYQGGFGTQLMAKVSSTSPSGFPVSPVVFDKIIQTLINYQASNEFSQIWVKFYGW